MLATKAFDTIKKNMTPNADGSITLRRPFGVCKAVVIPAEYLDESKVECTYAPNKQTKQIEVSFGETVLTLADEIGVKDSLDFEVTFINNNTALIELVDGVLYAKNASGVAFGFDTTGKLIRNTTNIRWLSVAEMYEAVAARFMYYYNVNSREVTDYIYNVTVKFHTQYKVHCKSDVARNGCLSTYEQGTPSWNTNISIGEFDFIQFEPDEPVKKKDVLYSRKPVENVEDMSYEEQQEYFRQQAEAEMRAEQAKENARLDEYGSDFDDDDFDDFSDDDDDFADEDYDDEDYD